MKETKEQKELRVESEYAQFVAKCIYEAAEKKAHLNGPGDRVNWIHLQDLAEICQQPIQAQGEVEEVTADELIDFITQIHADYLKAQDYTSEHTAGYILRACIKFKAEKTKDKKEVRYIENTPENLERAKEIMEKNKEAFEYLAKK